MANRIKVVDTIAAGRLEGAIFIVDTIGTAPIAHRAKVVGTIALQARYLLLTQDVKNVYRTKVDI